jgi:hypothetical protein
MDFDAALGAILKTHLYFSALWSLDFKFGLPCFIYYRTTFQLLVKVWAGCYGLEDYFGFSVDECGFLFRWFLLGGVLDPDELQAVLALALKWCVRNCLPLLTTAWSALAELFRFASQHGKLEQPWGVNCMRWIQKHRL